MRERTCAELVKDARNVKGHLERVLRCSDGLMNAKDRAYLAQKAEELEYDASHRRDMKYGGIPFDGFDRDSVRRAIRHARLYKATGKELYVIDGEAMDKAGVGDMANEALKHSKYLNCNKFLSHMAKSSGNSGWFSARQIVYLELIRKRIREKIVPHLAGKIFNRGVYQGKAYDDCSRLLSFADHGSMIGTVSKDCLKTVRDNWYDSEKGLVSLRDAMADKIRKGKLKVGIERYAPIINDLELFFRTQDKK